MTKTIRLILFGVFLFSASFASADLYQWKDKDDVIHITDDIKKVPESYRDKVKVFKSTPLEKKRETEVEAPPSPATQPPMGVELYGDHTLEWWTQTFTRKRDEIQMLESTVTSKRQFIEIFEGGRRFGQTFGPSEVETYSRYKKELPEDERRLLTLKEELDELKRKATIVGVPREIRE